MVNPEYQFTDDYNFINNHKLPRSSGFHGNAFAYNTNKFDLVEHFTWNFTGPFGNQPVHSQIANFYLLRVKESRNNLMVFCVVHLKAKDNALKRYEELM